jgi:hypothetical protein
MSPASGRGQPVRSMEPGPEEDRDSAPLD